MYKKKDFFFPNHNEIKDIFKQEHSLIDIFKSLKEMIQLSDDIEKKTWAINLLNELNLKSPTSLIVEHELIKRGYKFSSYAEGLQNDLNLVIRFYESSDFIEGIRALIIDKDRTPKWKYNSIYDIDDQKEMEIINSYFKEVSIKTNL